MILIAVYWVFLFLLFLPAGVLLSKILNLNTKSTALLVLMGIALLTTGFTAIAFFTNLGAGNLVAWGLLSVVSAIIFREDIRASVSSSLKEVKQLPSYLKWVMAALVAAMLLKSAQFPFTIDNESYYVQSIKWFNEYGLVKGMANLHIFFAQNSSWHILQAGIDFSFITNRINDINGFLFITCSVYYLTESQKYSTGKTLYWLGFMPLFWPLLFQFIPAPSPDLPCLLLIPVIIHLYLQNTDENNSIKIAFFLFLFLVLVKLTIVPIGLVFIPFVRQKKMLWFITGTAVPVFALWVLKNIISSGYALYPLALLKTNYDWAVPQELFDFMIKVNANDGYYGSPLAPPVDTLYTRLKSWLLIGGFDGIINKLTIAVLIALPFIKAVREQKKYRLIYAALILNFLALLLTSPQFRYFLHVPLCAGLFISAAVFTYLKNSPLLYKALYAVSCASVFVLLFNLSLSSVTQNKYHQTTGSFSPVQLYRPERNTRYPDLEFKQIRLGNLDFYSPTENFFLYGTADGPLPCVNAAQLRFFKKKMGIIPQLRGNTPAEGFRSEKVPQ